MNPRIANLIAIETGILIGLMSWLVYSRFPSPEPRTAEETQESTAARFTKVAPVSKPENQRPYAVAYHADRERSRPVEEQPAQLAQSYYQEIAAQPYANSAPDNGSIAVDSPSYAEVEQEQAAVPSDYLESPQTVIYAQPAQFVVFSNRRRFANRFRSMPLRGVFNPITQQRPDRRNSPLSDPRMVSGPNVSTPSPPAEGFRPRETVRQTGVTGSQQKRVGSPASPGMARRSAP